MHKFISTFGYIGLAPIAPGTFGSIGAFCLAMTLFECKNPIYTSLFIALATFFIGLISSEKYSKSSGSKDPKEVVIDEVCGYFVSLSVSLFYSNPSLILLIINLVFFRIFDILKPYPISYIDKNTKGGLGIMLDDVLAGIFSGITTTAILFACKKLGYCILF